MLPFLFNILKTSIHGVGVAGKVYLDFGAVFAAVYFYDAAFKAFEGAFYNYNAVVFVKAPNKKFPGQVNKVVCLSQLGREFVEVINKSLLPAGRNLDNVVVHQEQYSGIFTFF